MLRKGRVPPEVNEDMKISNAIASLLLLLPLLTLVPNPSFSPVDSPSIEPNLNESDSALAQEQQWETYENPDFGITIQHPSNWGVASSTTDASMPPEGMQQEIVDFRLAEDDLTNEPSVGTGPILDGRLVISIQKVDSYLDTDT